MTVAAPVEVAINDYHLIYVIAIATFVLIIRKNAKWLKDIEPLTIERWWKIFQISNIEMAYLLLWALTASMSFLTLFSAPVGLALMVIGYRALGWMMRWIFNNKLKQNMAYYV